MSTYMWRTNDDLLTSIGYIIFNREGYNNEDKDWMCKTYHYIRSAAEEKITKNNLFV